MSRLALELPNASDIERETSNKSTKKQRKIDAKTVQKRVHVDTSSQNASEVATELKKDAFRGPRGVPGGSRELPESPQRDPRASLGGLRSTPGAPPERPTRPTELRRAQNNPLGAQKAPSGGLRDLLWRDFAIVSGANLIELFLRSECLKSCLLPLMFSLFSSPLFSLLPPVLSMAAAALPPSYQRQSSKGAPGCAQR